MDLITLSWAQLVEHGGRVLIAFVLALPIAWEREAETRLVGLRTLPLVAVACCTYILVGAAVVGDDPTAHGRILSGLVAGIGFIGGGAILKGDREVRGTATAASILSTGIMGAAVAYGLVGIAVLISATTLATLLLLSHVQTRLGRRGGDRGDD